MTDVAAAASKPAHTHPQPVTISFSKQAQAAAALKEKEKQQAAAATTTDKPAAAATADAAPLPSASPPSPALNGTSYAQAYSAQKEKAATAAAASGAAASQPPKHNSSGSGSGSAGGKDAAGKKLSVVPPPHMSRSRSTGGDSAQSQSVGLSPALSPHAANPHPMPVGTFSPAAPILLEHPWSMFLDDTNLWGVKTVEECLARMGYLGTVDSIQAFWIYFNALASKLLTPAKLGANSSAGSMNGPAASPVASPQGGGGGNGRYNWRIFDSLITPVWEDELHVAGGKFILRCGGNGELRATKFIWTKLVLSMVGSNFLHQDIVCGCVLACRPHKKEIQIWIKHPPAKLKVPAESAMNVPQPAAKEANKDAAAAAAKTEAKEGETAPADAATAAGRSTSVSPARPAASPSPVADPISHCSCHVDPLVCFANDLRFLLGVALVPVPAALGAPAQGTPGSGDRAIKIEYVPHEITMADVAARNKRLKTKTHGRDRASSSVGGGDAKLSASAADAQKKGQPLSQKQQDQLIKDAKAERERKRAAESKAQQAAIAAANLTKMKATAGAAGSTTPNPSASPPPVSSPIAGSTTPSLGPAATTAATGTHRKSTASSSGGHTWADASDNDDDDLSHSRKESLDLGIDSDAYATSSYNSAASSVQGTPLLTGRSIMTTSRAAGAGGRKESLGQGVMGRQSSDPTGTASSSSSDLLSSLERDTRSFEGSVNDQGFGPPGASSKVAAPLPDRSPAYLELQRRQQKSGATPLRLSGGERSYHPEPDSPGFNGTPVPSPSQTPLGFITPILGASSAGSSASTTPTPRSPFTAHSPRSGRNAATAAAARGFRPGHMVSASHGGGKSGMYSPTQPSPGYEDAEDYADEDGMQGMLQYDTHHAHSASRQQEDQFFQLDRTRDLLRTPLDLDSLSLPPGATQKGGQRLRDPSTTIRQASGSGNGHGDSGPTSPNVLSSPQPLNGGPAQAHSPGASGSKGSILAMVAKPASVSSLKDLSMLLAAQQAMNKANSNAEQLPPPALTAERASAFSSVDGESANEGRSRTGSTASASGLSSADDDASNGHSASTAPAFVPKKSRPSPPPAAVPLKKRGGGSKASAKKSAATDDDTALASKRPSKPRSLKVWLAYAATALVLAALIYLLFFTTLAPDEDVAHLLPAKTISEKGAGKIKVPKHAK